MIIMPDKKTSVLSQIFCVFQRKKTSCDDIVTAADKVIEEYIFCKNKLIRQKCRSYGRRESIALSILLISVAASIVFLYFILSP